MGAAPLLVAAVLAFSSLNFGLPFLLRPDEDVMVGRAVRMVSEHSLDPMFANYPPLVFYVFAAAEGSARCSVLARCRGRSTPILRRPTWPGGSCPPPLP